MSQRTSATTRQQLCLHCRRPPTDVWQPAIAFVAAARLPRAGSRDRSKVAQGNLQRLSACLRQLGHVVRVVKVSPEFIIQLAEN